VFWSRRLYLDSSSEEESDSDDEEEDPDGGEHPNRIHLLEYLT